MLRHCSRLCEEKFPQCVNHVTSYAYLIKEPLDALSATIWPCSRLKKIPIRSFLCRQNHFPRLIRHQTNNCCYFLLDSFFVSGTSTLSPIVISTKNLFPPTFEYLPFMCFCWSRCDTTQNPSVNFESAKLLFLSGMQYLFVRNAIPSDLQSRDYKSHQSRERETLSNTGK